MPYSKSLALIGLALAAPAATNAFVVTSPSTSRPHSTLSATREPNDERATPADAIRNLAAASALTLGLLLPSTDALAAPDIQFSSNNNAVLSSTVELSATIRTMDFSLPSGSYDSIADPNASGKESLTKDTIINTTPSKKAKKEDSGASAKEAAAAARADRVAERQAKEAEQAKKDEQSAIERDENIKAMRLEKAAKRAEAQAAKDAAAADKEEAKFKGATFVDTSMPTY